MIDIDLSSSSLSFEVDILLSTYNGQKYVDELLSSLNSQSFPSWNLIVRDDCSSDNTVSILQSSVSKFGKSIEILDAGPSRLGPAQSFSRLLESSLASYTMFCDQDDIWLNTKIISSLKAMHTLEKFHGKDYPLLVHTDLTVVDNNLNTIAESFWKHQNLDPNLADNFSRVLVQNVVTGCTVLINKALRDLANPIPNDCIMHDWWVALVAAAFGKIAYVADPTILYRQHLSNSIGSKKWGLSYILSRTINQNNIKTYFERTIRQSQAFLDAYENILNHKNLELVKIYSSLEDFSFFQKRFALLNNGYYKFGSLRNLGLFVAI